MLLLTSLTWGCAEAPIPQLSAGGVLDDSTTAIDTIVSTSSGLIGYVADMTIGVDGRVYIADELSDVVHVLDPSGRPLSTIGRSGEGPGEFSQPMRLHLQGDSLFVADYRNSRVQVLTIEGRYLSSFSIPFPPSIVGMGTGGLVVAPVLGRDSALALIYTDGGVVASRLGVPLAPLPPGPSNFARGRARIAAGEIPEGILNRGRPVVAASDGSIWFILDAAGVVQRYSESGQQLLSVTLDGPEYEAAHQRWIARTAAAPPNTIPFFDYLRSGRIVGGDLWVLMGTEDDEPARILVLSSSGSVLRRFTFEGVIGGADFVVDEIRNLIYFFIGDTAELLRLPLDSP